MATIFYLQIIINNFKDQNPNYIIDGTLFMQVTKFIDNTLNNLEEEKLDELIDYYGGILNLIDYYLNQYENNFIITIHTEKKKMKIICLTPKVINDVYDFLIGAPKTT